MKHDEKKEKQVELKEYYAYIGIRMMNGDKMIGLFGCDLEEFDHKLVRACVKKEILGAKTILVVVK